MKIDDYVIGRQSKTSFCYELERKLDQLGRITGQLFLPLPPPTSLMPLNVPIVSADGDIVDLLGGASLLIVIDMPQFT